jgi:hypothetical protein
MLLGTKSNHWHAVPYLAGGFFRMLPVASPAFDATASLNIPPSLPTFEQLQHEYKRQEGERAAVKPKTMKRPIPPRPSTESPSLEHAVSKGKRIINRLLSHDNTGSISRLGGKLARDHFTSDDYPVDRLYGMEK